MCAVRSCEFYLFNHLLLKGEGGQYCFCSYEHLITQWMDFEDTLYGVVLGPKIRLLRNYWLLVAGGDIYS